MQAARHLIAGIVPAKFTARVQDRKNDRHGRNAHLRLNVNRDAASVVRNANAVSLLNGHLNVITEAGQRLINGVINDLVDQMMQTARARGADIHTRTFADGLQPLQYLDLAAVIFMLRMLLF